MDLKLRCASPSAESSLTDPWSGLWGSVVADKKSQALLRIELPFEHGRQAIHGLAYGSLSRWLWMKSDEDLEQAEFHFGHNVVKVAGKGLGPLIDALEEGRLKLLRVCSKDLPCPEPWIKSMSVVLAGEKTTSDPPFGHSLDDTPGYEKAIRLSHRPDSPVE